MTTILRKQSEVKQRAAAKREAEKQRAALRARRKHASSLQGQIKAACVLPTM